MMWGNFHRFGHFLGMILLCTAPPYHPNTDCSVALCLLTLLPICSYTHHAHVISTCVLLHILCMMLVCVAAALLRMEQEFSKEEKALVESELSSLQSAVKGLVDGVKGIFGGGRS